MASRVMDARFPGTCRTCGGGIAVNARIVWTKEEGAKGQAHHYTCVHQAVETVAPPIVEPPIASIAERELDKRIEAAVARRMASLDAPTSVTVNVSHGGVQTASVKGAHPQFAALLTYLSATKNVYAFGAPGAGKSYAANQLAVALESRACRYVPLSPQTQRSSLFGYMDAHSHYFSTATRDVWEFGGVLVLEEVDNTNAALLAETNAMIASGYGEFPDARVPRHADCYILALGNTPGFGPTPAFPERRPLDRAFRDRFTFLRWEYALKHEKEIARSLTTSKDIADAWCTWVQRVRKYAATEYRALTCSPRSIYAGVPLLEARCEPLAVAHATLFQGIEDGVISKILNACPLPSITWTAEAAAPPALGEF